MALVDSLENASRHRPHPRHQHPEVLQASEQFHAALERFLNGYSEPMMEVWTHELDVTAMHAAPGRQVGWEEVGVVDGNGVVVVPMAQAAVVLEQAKSLLATEHLLQEKIKAGATIGELVNVDEVFKSAFSHQKRAVERESF